MDHSTSCTGVLFSGGVDSAVLAALAADVMASTPTRNHKLHLYNVSFGPDRLKSADRQAALVSYDSICKKIKVDANKSGKVDSAVNVDVIFHDIAVDWQQVCDVEQHVRTLLSPKSTVMDVNIATALWFASSGAASTVGGESKVKDFHSASSDGFSPPSPRVLLLGMGADEQMGGYGRHRKAFTEGGWDLLRKELKMDQDRLWERNLGRDDRLVSDHGKEARFPFLDAHVVSFLTALQRDKPHLICNMDLPPGEGDKQILRLVAKRLGLDHASGLVKRAIQFGSRISHLSDTKRFGSRRKAKGETKI
jgi:asparagine synthetase B (glutamine-hydrolysing)